MNLKNSINQCYFDMSINELRLMNSGQLFPNISYNSLLYLDIISYKQNCTASFIANAMNVSKSAVTVKINELIELGLVIKTQCTQDKRINYLTLNERAAAVYNGYDSMLHAAVKKIEGKYSKKEIETFCQMINSISKSYSESIENE